MGQKLVTLAVLLSGVGLSSNAAQAESGTGFFGVGLTALAAKPSTPSGVIYRNAVYTPGAVAIGLAAQGYEQVQLISRGADGYIFAAVSRANGQRFLLTVAAWRGEIVSAVRG